VLHEILKKAQQFNFLGNPPIDDHIRNANGFLHVIQNLSKGMNEAKLYDLGSGGGVPALILIQKLEKWNFVLLERKEKRANFLLEAINVLNAVSRVEVICDEVENVARVQKHEFSADFVTARAFGPPTVTAECACRLLKQGGHLVVSEPPQETGRWTNKKLSVTGLTPINYLQFEDSTFQVLQQVEKPEDNLPRKPGTPRKRPLW
jgi:16S rRNA G527 N7-methylase RsmG